MSRGLSHVPQYPTIDRVFEEFGLLRAPCSLRRLHCLGNGNAQRSLHRPVERLVAFDVPLQPLLLALQPGQLARCGPLPAAWPRLHRRDEQMQRARLELVEARERDTHRLARRRRAAHAAPRLEQQRRRAARGIAAAHRLGAYRLL
jgi:hypothetical protein